MKLRCLAIDDEPIALDKTSDFIKKIPFLDLLASFDNGLEALGFIQSNNIDLVFLDIQMPHLNGLQLAKILPANVQVIFITAYQEYALEGYTLNVTDYLLKPFAFDRLLQAANKALEKHGNKRTASRSEAEKTVSANKGEYIFVKTEFRLQRVKLSDIMYVQGMKDYLMLHTLSEKIMTLQSFKVLLQKLPEDDFVRIHKSFVVAIKHIDFIERSRVSVNKELLPVSDTYKSKFFNYLEKKGLV